MIWLLLFLSLSVVAVVAGGLLAGASRERPSVLRLLRGFSAGAIGAIIFFHLVPESYADLGAAGLLVFVLGLMSVSLLEWLGGHDEAAERVGPALGVAELVLFGLSVHAAIDGVGLVAAAREERLDSPMAWAIIAHRLPVAAVLTYAFLKRVSMRAAWLRLSLLVAATFVGAIAGEAVLRIAGSGMLAGLRAFVSGTLLHILLHDFLAYPAESSSGRHREVASFLVGLAVILPFGGIQLLTGAAADASGPAFGQAFVDLFVEAAPFILVGALFAGILATRLGMQSVRFLRGSNDWSSAARGTAFGLPLPICSCGILPAVDPLVRAGAPAAAVTAFLLATPEIGVDSVFISWKLLGGPLTLVRVAMAVGVVFGVALLVAKLGQPRLQSAASGHHHAHNPGSGDHEAAPAHAHSRWARTKKALRAGFADTLDEIGPWLVLGVTVGALVQVLAPPEGLASIVPPPWDVFLFSLIGIPLYVCASGATPMAAVFLVQGVSPGAVLAFLMVGPATNVATMGYFSRMWGRRASAVLGLSALGLAMGLGLLVNAVVPSGWVMTEEALFGEGHHLVELVAAVALTLLLLAGVWRRGPLGWLAVVFDLVPIGHHHGRINVHEEEDHCC